ncbi:MAG: DUF4337 domain-containing protein [Thermoguttaceae bacterium]|jgi:LPS O-antigen subunit length determinant protein (WzzB/FepE family)
MDQPEVPLEQTQEDLEHHAHGSSEKWVLGVALSAAFLAVLAAVTSLIAEHHSDEAMILQIQSSDQWNYYQAKGIKANLLNTKTEILSALGKQVDEKDESKLEKYQKEQAEIKDKADELQRESAAHLQRHSILARSVTMFQIAIAVGAIAVLTKRRRFWFAAIAFGGVGVVFLVYGLWMM